MTHNLDSSQTAVISHENKWIPISQQEPPQGAKCLVIDDTQGLAYVRAYQPSAGWTHWFPLPVLPKDEN